MAETEVITNSWLTYIENRPYIYPTNDKDLHAAETYTTGWHIFPSILWKHFVTPKQWQELLIKYEAYHVKGINITCFNMVPMTTQLAIQSTNIFTAFNNCIYAMGYTDNLYETNWENWFDQDFNIVYKEGLYCKKDQTTTQRWILPKFWWRIPNARARRATYNNKDGTGVSGVFYGGQNDTGEGVWSRPTGVIWDPLNRPDQIKEMRPGKNAMHFKWECHPCDEGKWFNLDHMAWWYPYTPEGPYNIAHPRPGQFKYTSEVDPDRLSSQRETNPHINDYTMPNWADLPVCPMAWWWQEMKSSISPVDLKENVWQWRYMDLFFTGTEKEQYMYGPTQHFIKLLPIFDANGTHIEITASIGVKMELILDCKKRRSALYCPTWGPVNWFDAYSAKSSDRRFTASWIRYRSGGMRRTWQNIGDSADTLAHPRESPLNNKTTNPDGTGQGGTRAVFTYTTSSVRSPAPSAPPAPSARKMDIDVRPQQISPIPGFENISTTMI